MGTRPTGPEVQEVRLGGSPSPFFAKVAAMLGRSPKWLGLEPQTTPEEFVRLTDAATANLRERCHVLELQLRGKEKNCELLTMGFRDIQKTLRAVALTSSQSGREVAVGPARSKLGLWKAIAHVLKVTDRMIGSDKKS